MEPLTGHLLISNANLFDPNFRRTVVLIGHHDDQGAVGVVLNQPLGVTVREAVPPLGDLVEPEEQLFDGGPVEPASIVVLADFLDPSRSEVLAMGSIGFLPPEAGDDIGEAIRRARVFAGYAGWGPGQLEGELEEEAWIVEPPTREEIFTEDAEGLWAAVLRRKGRRYALLSTMPLDPSMN